jgi:hypothetical protein
LNEVVMLKETMDSDEDDDDPSGLMQVIIISQ